MATTFPNREVRPMTVRMPLPIYEQAKHFVDTERSGTSASISLNHFFVSAIQAYVTLHTRREIDAAFAGMAEDEDCQKQSQLLCEEFETSDWEALTAGEAQK
jgi:hypothetical protein